MRFRSFAAFVLAGVAAVAFAAAAATAEEWPPAKAPAVAEADGYVVIPDAAVPPDRGRVYRAVFDATRAADSPGQLVPAVNMAGSELNALAVAGVPSAHTKFVVVFHGPAVDGLLDDAHYRAKFGTANPNLPVLAKLRNLGVELYVCGQHLAFSKIDPATLSKDVRVASDALIVLMAYQGDGFGLLSF